MCYFFLPSPYLLSDELISVTGELNVRDGWVIQPCYVIKSRELYILLLDCLINAISRKSNVFLIFYGVFEIKSLTTATNQYS